MAEVVVRFIQGEELLETAFPLGNYAFASTPPLRTRAELLQRLPDPTERDTLVLFEDGRPLATGASIAMTQNVRGLVVPMGGVASVATDPLARRQGYARRVMRGLFERMRERGQPVSTLYPFRPSFYSRLGYASLPARPIYSLDPASLAPLLRQDLGGQIIRTLLPERAALYRAFLTRMQAEVHGLALDPPRRAAANDTSADLWLLTASVAGEVVGLLTYRLTGAWGDPVEMTADDLLYRNSHGKYLLLQALAHHGDHVRRVRLTLRPGDHLTTWLDDVDAVIHSAYSLRRLYEPMGRVVVVEELAGIGVGPASVTVRLVDPDCPWNAGVWTFTGQDGRLAIQRGGRAEAELTIQALSALVYGGHDPADFRFRDWGDPPPATQAALRALFPAALPYVHTEF